MLNKETFKRENTTRTLSSLLEPESKIYVYLADESVKTLFMKTAEKEGYRFGDGEMPTNRQPDEVMTVNEDHTINYIGFAGRMAFHNATNFGDRLIIRIDFLQYMNEESNFIYGEMKNDESSTDASYLDFEPSIGDGSAAFLVYDKDIQHNDNFFKRLEREGFHFWNASKGWYSSVCWVYININSKLIARGMPGIRVTSEIGNHAITISEFDSIYAIYKKYKRLSPLKFE